jgi:hypothetical protein
MKYYKYVRVLKNNRRVSSFVDKGTITAREYTRLEYNEGKITEAPEDSAGIFVTTSPKIHSGNVFKSSSSKAVELWEVRAYGRLKKYFEFDKHTFNFSSVKLVKCLEKKTIKEGNIM